MGFEQMEPGKSNKRELPPPIINPEKPQFSFMPKEIEKARKEGGPAAVELLMKRSGQANERLKKFTEEKAKEEKKKADEKKRIFNVQDMQMH